MCWILDALFNGMPDDSPRLLFKGGTSLSKGFGLISRFSEDIGVTVFRDDLGEGASIAELQNLSRTKREAKLDAIKDACTTYIQGPMTEALIALVAAAAERTGLPQKDFQVRTDDDDRQTLLLWYPTATPVEALPGIDLSVANVTTVDPERTFWDRP